MVRTGCIDWTPAMIKKLEKLVSDELTCTQIGLALGVSKNAVIGKMRRLNLVSKSGCRRPVVPVTRKPRSAAVVRPPRTDPSTIIPQLSIGTEELKSDETAAPFKNDVVQVSPYVATRSVRFGFDPCSWPIGSPGTANFRYCNGPTVTGKPYCEDHCAIAYRRRDQRQSAA